MKYSGFWRRFLAQIIDVLILFIPELLISVFLPYFGGLLILILYKPVFESSVLQATPGKRIMGIKVAQLNGQRISFARALARYFLTFVSAFICLFGYIMAAFTPRKQALHDMITDVVVVFDPEDLAQSQVSSFDVWKKRVVEIYKDLVEIDEGRNSQGSSQSNSSYPVQENQQFQKSTLPNAEVIESVSTPVSNQESTNKEDITLVTPKSDVRHDELMAETSIKDSSTEVVSDTQKIFELIEKLQELYKNGVLSQEEYETKKADILKNLK